MTAQPMRELVLSVIGLVVYLLCRVVLEGSIAMYVGAFAETVAILALIVVAVHWRWMPRTNGQTPSELLVKAGTAALVLVVSLFLVNLTRDGRSALAEAAIDFLSFLGLVGTVVLLAFAFIASRVWVRR